MSKIICDICGTVYPDTADKCPICGYARNAEGLDDELELAEDIDTGKGGHYAAGHRKNREIFDYEAEGGTAAPAPDGEDSFSDEDLDQQEPHSGKSSAALIVILVIAIVGMIGMIGFLFFRFLIPYRSTPATETTVVTTEAPVTETTIPVVPCESLVMTSGKAELSREGQYWLIHAVALPDDTTDIITYQSMDENVAVVNEEGRITAVGEGETVVLVNCGTVQMTCPVVVSYAQETEPSTEAATEPVEQTEEQTEPSAETEAVTEAETEAAEATEDTVPVSSETVTLKLKKTDISFGVRGVSFTLELDCKLDPLQVKWSVGNPNVAVVDGEGTVTTVGPGTTRVYAEYEGQKVECIVRCLFS